MKPVEIFFSYAHEDERLMNKVRQQLVLYEREGYIMKKYDRDIRPGQEWEGILDEDLKHSKIILLFASPDFIESQYCYNIEMKIALRRHEAGNAIVIPIILRPCAWQNAPFGKLQALPKDGKPITEWDNLDRVTLDVAEGIMGVVRELTDNSNNSRRPSIGTEGSFNKIQDLQKQSEAPSTVIPDTSSPKPSIKKTKGYFRYKGLLWKTGRFGFQTPTPLCPIDDCERPVDCFRVNPPQYLISDDIGKMQDFLNKQNSYEFVYRCPLHGDIQGAPNESLKDLIRQAKYEQSRK